MFGRQRRSLSFRAQKEQSGFHIRRAVVDPTNFSRQRWRTMSHSLTDWKDCLLPGTTVTVKLRQPQTETARSFVTQCRHWKTSCIAEKPEIISATLAHSKVCTRHSANSLRSIARKIGNCHWLVPSTLVIRKRRVC